MSCRFRCLPASPCHFMARPLSLFCVKQRPEWNKVNDSILITHLVERNSQRTIGQSREQRCIRPDWGHIHTLWNVTHNCCTYITHQALCNLKGERQKYNSLSLFACLFHIQLQTVRIQWCQLAPIVKYTHRLEKGK